MGLRNKTRKSVVAKGFCVCRSIHSKARGLMFTNESTVRSRSLIFEFASPREQSLHMFFVFYPIDVLFLDEKKCVVDIKEDFRPFTLYNSRVLSQYVVELPSGVVSDTGTKVGDEIEWP